MTPPDDMRVNNINPLCSFVLSLLLGFSCAWFPCKIRKTCDNFCWQNLICHIKCNFNNNNKTNIFFNSILLSIILIVFHCWCWAQPWRAWPCTYAIIVDSYKLYRIKNNFLKAYKIVIIWKYSPYVVFYVSKSKS